MRPKTTTKPFCFRLKSRKICFRLDLNSPQNTLWNHYLEKEKAVKPAFLEITTLAREQLNEKRHNQTFILDMIYKHKEKVQLAVDEIFRLAIERYPFYQKQGQAPVLNLRDKYSGYYKLREEWKEKRP